jgi:two-component system sensor histidine kinase UhpB
MMKWLSISRRRNIGVACLLPGLATLCASAATPQRVLILDSFGRDVAPFNQVVSAFRTTLSRDASQRVDIYEAPLDMARFADSGFEVHFVDFIEHGFSVGSVDLVVPIGGPASRFVVQYRERLFGETPILFTAVDPRLVPRDALQTNATLVTQKLDLPGMIEDILQLQSDTTNVLVVFGSSPLEKFWVDQCRREWQRFTNRVSFTWLDNLSLEQMQQRTQKLPPHSFIFFGLLLTDAARVPYDNDEPLKAIHATANAPIFGYFRSQFGLGAIGGRLYQESQVGARAAHVAVRILRGERPERIPPEIYSSAQPAYDCRELKRWGIKETQLPAGSLIEFREGTFWEQYRLDIVGVLMFCSLQTALIVGLIVNRARRRQAHAQATLIAGLSSKFINLPSSEVDREIEDAQRRVCKCFGLDLSSLWQSSTTDPDSVTLTHLYRPLGWPAIPESMNGLEYFPWCAGQLQEGKVICVSSLEALPREAARDWEVCREFGIKSILTFPLSAGGGQVFGALGFNTTRQERSWPEEVVEQLQVVAQIFANALVRKQSELAFRESEARLSLAANAAGAGLWCLYLETGCFWLTDLTRELFGFTRDEVVMFERFLQKVHPEDQELVRRTVQALVQSKNEGTVEYRLVQPGETFRWVLMRGRVRCGATGQPEYLMGAAADITERRGAVESLRRLQQQNELLLTSAVEGILGLDLQGNHTFVNPAAAGMLGYTPGELLGRHSHGTWHHTKPDGTPYAEKDCLIHASYHDGAVHRVSNEVFWRKNGTSFPVEYASTPIRQEGRVVGAVVTFTDISERKRVEEALRASEEEGRVTFEQAAMGIAHLGTDGRWLRVNDKLCAIVGYEREELLKMTFQDITHSDDLKKDLHYVRQLMSGQIKTYSREKRYLRKDRSLVWVNLSVSLVRSAAGEPRHFLSVIEDITARKRAEAALHDLSGRLIHAQEQERTRLAKELHDGLSQNLALLAVELELFGQNPSPEPAQVSKRLQQFSERAKELSGEVHRLSHDLHPAKLEQLGLAAALAGFCREVEAGGLISVRFTTREVPRALPEEVALCLYRVTQEAIQNVVKHSGAKRATVELVKVDTEMQLSVADNGRGFVQGAKAATGALGLIGMRERVRLVNGEIAVESKLGKGTRVQVRVPLNRSTIT